MASLGSAHIQVSEQEVSRMKAEEHLRTVEKKPRNEDHNRRGDHSPRRGSTDRRSNRERRRRREWDHDESSNASFPGDLGDMVTVDEIGFEDQDDINMETDENNPDVNREPGLDDDYVIPDYDPNVSFGKNYVIPVSGYFCKLCHKFYTTETTAKLIHCKSKQHYDKFHDVMMNKLMAKVLCKTEDKEQQKEIEKRRKEKDKNSESEISVKDEKEKVEDDEGKSDDENLDKVVNGEQEGKKSVEKTGEEQTDQSKLSITESEEKMDVIETDEDEKKKGEEKGENEPEENLTVTVSKAKNKAIKKVAQKAKRGKKT